MRHKSNTTASHGKWLALRTGFIRFLNIILILSIPFLIQGCWGTDLFPHTPEFNPPDFIDQLENHQTMWENKNITDYRISLSLPPQSNSYANLSDSLLVEVRSGVVTSIVDTNGHILPLTDNFTDSDLLTIPDLFDFLNNIYTSNPVSVTVSYDPVFGYPRSIDVNPYREPCCQGYSIQIKSFEQILP